MFSEYGLFYNLCFQGFDDCLSDEEEVEEEDDISSLNGFIVNDKNLLIQLWFRI